LQQMPRWDAMTWPEIQTLLAKNPLVVLATGSIEQHGPHLPLATDVLIPTGLADRTAGKLREEERRRTVLLPPLAYTYAPESNGWPGTLNLDGETLTRVAADLARELARMGVAEVLLLNGHMESQPFLWEGMRLGRDSHTRIRMVNWWDLVPASVLAAQFDDASPGWTVEHAGPVETSVLWALYPSQVRKDCLPDDPAPGRPPYRKIPLEPESLPPSGSFAPTGTASADIGDALCEAVVGQLCRLTREVL